MKGIYITGGGYEGIGRALEMTGKTGEIKVICHDVIPDTVRLLKNGSIEFTLGQNPEQQGYLLIKTMFDYLIKKHEPAREIINIPIEIITADTVDSVYQLNHNIVHSLKSPVW